ncbi:cellulase family glycosylhydrolase [Planctomycetota bacterium]
MSTLFNDMKYAFRQLFKTPSFILITILTLAMVMGIIVLSGKVRRSKDTKSCSLTSHNKLGLIHLNENGTQFICTECGNRFFAWGFNYDHDDSGRLIEDYWQEEWETVVEDFNEMRDLGANLVRIHLQLARFMETPDRPNQAALQQLARLVELAETTGLYLDITGLACYHPKDVPEWYDTLDDNDRWEVQARFWEAVAQTCAKSNAIFCYDLMNEPFLPGRGEKASVWLGDAFGGKHFMQRITLDLAGRTPKQVAGAWVRKLVAAIQKHDPRHMITVGAIAWVHTFPKAKPIFYAKEVSKSLDFVSVHVYPQKGEIKKALTALKAYDIGKPLVIEETSPLYCGIEDFNDFIERSYNRVDGYVGFYWGKTIDEYRQSNDSISAGIMAEWLKYFDTKKPEIFGIPQQQEDLQHEVISVVGDSQD